MISGTTSAIAQVQITLVADRDVFASFESTDPTGCIRTGVFVVASFLAEINRPARTTSPLASVSISQFDDCLGLLTMAAEGTTSELVFEVNPALRAASLETTIPLVDSFTGRNFDVKVVLRWTGTGLLSRDVSNTHIVEPGFVIDFSRSVDLTRPAQARGTISDGSTNFTPIPSIDGQIERIRSGQVTVQVQTP